MYFLKLLKIPAKNQQSAVEVQIFCYDERKIPIVRCYYLHLVIPTRKEGGVNRGKQGRQIEGGETKGAKRDR